MSGVNGTLALSSLVASLDRDALLELVRGRKLTSPDSVDDPIDLASELLRPDSIAQALAELPRAALAALTGLADLRGGSEPSPTTEVEALRALGLLGLQPDGSVVSLPEVSAQLLTQLASRNVTPADLHASPANVLARVVDVDTSGWFTAALTAVGQVAWLLRALSRSPVRLNRNGAVPSAWVKSIQEDLGIAEASELLWLIGEAGLTETYAGMLTAAGDTWLRSTHTERWLVLAQAAERLQPSPMWRLFDRFEEPGGRLPTGLSVTEVAAQLPHEFPLVTDATVKTTRRTLDLWERLGITVGGHLSEFGATLRSPAVPEPGFPVPTPGVYVQPDLSVVVPGLLSPADEADLAAIATPEQIGVASTLRITEASLAEAFDRGESLDEIRSTIARLSLTGIPQPLDYLLSSLATRAGSIRVFTNDGDEGRTRIEFDRADMRSTVRVDRGLAHLQLHEVATEPSKHPAAGSGAANSAGPRPLFSRLRADHVLAALLDSRYPAVAAGPTGAVGPTSAAGHRPAANASEGGTSTSTASSSTAAAKPSDAAPARDPLTELVDRVRGAAERGPSDLGRQVTLAIRDKTTLRVTVEVRGHTREFTILPMSLSAGRMRALDEAAGVERTLPLDAITHIAQVPAR